MGANRRALLVDAGPPCLSTRNSSSTKYRGAARILSLCFGLNGGRIRDGDASLEQGAGGGGTEGRIAVDRHRLPAAAENAGDQLGDGNVIGRADDIDAVMAVDEPRTGVES